MMQFSQKIGLVLIEKLWLELRTYRQLHLLGDGGRVRIKHSLASISGKVVLALLDCRVHYCHLWSTTSIAGLICLVFIVNSFLEIHQNSFSVSSLGICLHWKSPWQDSPLFSPIDKLIFMRHTTHCISPYAIVVGVCLCVSVCVDLMKTVWDRHIVFLLNCAE